MEGTCFSSSARGDGDSSSEEEEVVASGIAFAGVVVVVRSTTPLRGVDRGLVRRAVGRPGLRIETGDFDVVGRCEVRFVVVERFDGVISTMSSSSETMAARGVNLLAGEIITTCGVVFLKGGVYSPAFTATGFVGVVVVTRDFGLGIGA